MFHENDPDGWDGPTGFYAADGRKRLLPDESKTWSPLHLWADPKYGKPTMSLAVEADPYFTPPADRQYLLELTFVPEGIMGAPPVGTVWELPLDEMFVLTVPTYQAEDGLGGYRFSFTMTAVPEPASAIGLVVGALLLRGRRR